MPHPPHSVASLSVSTNRDKCFRFHFVISSFLLKTKVCLGSHIPGVFGTCALPRTRINPSAPHIFTQTRFVPLESIEDTTVSTMASEIFSGPLPPNENVSYKLLTVMIIFLVMTTLFFVLRMYAKIKITRSIGWDDHLITAAWVSNFSPQSFLRRIIDPVKVFLVVNQSLTYASITYGVGRHVIYIPPLRLEYAAKLNFIAEILEVIDLYLVKASLAILVLRMKPRPLFRWMMYGCLVLLTAVNAAAVIIELAQCRPIQLNWNKELGRGSCWSGRVLLVSGYLVSGRYWGSTSQCA